MHYESAAQGFDPRTLVSRRVLEPLLVGSRIVDARVEELVREGRHVLELRPYPHRAMPPHVLQAVERAARSPVNPPSRGLLELRQAICDTVGAEIGTAIDPASEVLVTCGAMHALWLIFHAVLDPGDEVLVPSPCYFLEGIIQPLGARIVYVPMDERDEYRWDFGQLERAAGPHTKCLFLNTPINPTGRVLSEDELAAAADLAERHNLLVVADESYNKMIYDGLRHRSIAGFPGMRRRTVLVRSFTKSYAMPSWRVGFAIAPAGLTGPILHLLEWNLLFGSHVNQAAAAAAMLGPSQWLEDVAAEFQRNRDLLWPAIQRTRTLHCVRPGGGPFFFLNVSQLRGTCQDVSRGLLERYGVPVTPGVNFHEEQHVRMAFGGDPEILNETRRRLETAASEMKS
ncbi:MAG TPA: pyridoxal phosphate-dependent aminotransferase [Bryobacteraceae bacterium]|nr:pyridoxal phosphate-dependent aminotransferase [Bryobacteraceae bacterium]